MPTISLTDSSSITVNATVPDTSIIGKTPHSVLTFLHNDVLGALNQTLDQVQINSLGFGFNYAPELTFAGGSATFTGGVGAGGDFDLRKPSDSLFPKDQFGTTIGTNGSYYLGLSFHLNACATPTGTVGAFCLTLAAKASAAAALYLPFPKSSAGAFPTLKSSLETVLGSYKLPTKIDDIKAWTTGTVFTFDCQGSVSFTGSINMLAAVNPTASASFSSTAGPITVTAGPSVTVTGAFTFTGEYEVRLWKRDANTLQLGYYKKLGKSISVSLDASAGGDLEIGSYDLIAKLYGLLGDSGKLDKDWLAKNIPKDQADNVADAYKNAVGKKLSAEIDAECDTTFTDQAAFSWNFDLRTDGSDAQKALTDALEGKIDPLLQQGTLPQGVTRAGSVLDRIRETKRTFTFHFLGLFDYASVQDAVVHLKTQYTEDGHLILTDTVHAQLLVSADTPFVSSDKLRKVLVDDGTATISYAASFGKFIPSLTVGYTFFEYKGRGNSSDLSLFLQIADGVLGTDASTPWTAILQSGVNSQSASVDAVLNYDATSSAAFFLDGQSQPRPVTDFFFVCRESLLFTPGLGLSDELLDAFRDDAKWNALLDNSGSSQAIFRVLGVDLMNPPVWAHAAVSWVSQTTSWSRKMQTAAQALQNITQYLAQNPEADPTKDPKFQTRRQSFANAVSSAIQAAPIFDNAFGLFVMLHASKPLSKNVSLTYAGKTITYP